MNLNFERFINALKIKLSHPLPGHEAQLRMSPNLDLILPVEDSILSKAKKSSVLILLIPGINKIQIILTLRQDYDGVHSGQISLPGGKCEKTDHSVSDTALREANEEIGIDISKVKIIGELSKIYIPRSNYLVYPFVGYCDEKPEFYINHKEVKELIVVDIEMLLDEKNISEKEFITSNKMKVKAPFYKIRKFAVWGATAMIISEFIEILKK